VYNNTRKAEGNLLKKGSEEMQEMATNTEYILRMVLEMIEKCKTLEELKASVEYVLNGRK
jgi:hypothetical protein